MRYAVVIEKAGKGYSGYVPDLPGCIAAGPTAADVQNELARAIPFHLEGLRAAGQPVPKAQSTVEWIDV
jgi:predicted RNase H-like HicB family nuclease